MEFLASGDGSSADAREAARRLVGRALCRLALTGAEVIATLQSLLWEDAMRQVWLRFAVSRQHS